MAPTSQPLTKSAIGVSKYLPQVFKNCKSGGSLVTTTSGVLKHKIFTVTTCCIVSVFFKSIKIDGTKCGIHGIKHV